MAGTGAVIQMLVLLYVSLLYLLFWIAVLYAVVRMAGDAVTTALVALSVWVGFVIIIPALSNTVLRARYPVPLKADIASYKRHASETIWNTGQDTLVRHFLDNNPEFRGYYKPALDTRPWGDWAIAGYYDLLNRQVKAYADSAQRPLARRIAAGERLVQCNPVTLAQALFSEVAGTSLRQQTLFEQEVALFQKTWRRFIYGFQLTDTPLVPSDFERFPKFELHAYRPSNSLLLSAAWVWLIYTCFLTLWEDSCGRAEGTIFVCYFDFCNDSPIRMSYKINPVMHSALEINSLRKQYGYRTVLDIPTHRFDAGLTWIQGKNGSGKSTLLKILAGLLAYEGRILLGSVDLKKHPIAYRRLIAFSESEARFPPFVTGLDLLRLFREARKEQADRSAAFIADFDMGEYLPYPVQEYSAGMVKKLSLLLAFIGNPAFLLLDEPYITLDEAAMAMLTLWVGKRVEEGTNVILTSHQELPPHVEVHHRCVLTEGRLHRIDPV